MRSKTYCGASGFTLIETVVVLLLLSLATALVLPNFARFAADISADSELKQIRIELSGLSYKTMNEYHAVSADTPVKVQRLVESLENWQVTVLDPIVINASGACLGGRLRLSKDQIERLVVITPPFCDAELINNAP